MKDEKVIAQIKSTDAVKPLYHRSDKRLYQKPAPVIFVKQELIVVCIDTSQPKKSRTGKMVKCVICEMEVFLSDTTADSIPEEYETRPHCRDCAKNIMLTEPHMHISFKQGSKK